MKHFIIGMGEIGSALFRCLDGEVGDFDVKYGEMDKIDKVEYLHICFPMMRTFIADTAEYIEQLHPDITIIHSTVEVGTTRALKEMYYRVVHSPVRGTHPDIEKGLKTYIKYIGADTKEDYEKAADGLRGMKTAWLSPTEATELAKLLSLARYGLNISFAKEQEAICEKYGVLYEEVVKGWDITYNEGMLLEGRSTYLRPLIVPPQGRVGGHCVVPGMRKISDKSSLIRTALNVIGENTKIWHYTNIMDGVEIGNNCTIGSYVEIGRDVKIGDDCKIEAGAFIPQGVTVGDRVFIGPNVVFTNDKHPHATGEWELKETIVEDDVSIGANSTILCGITLREHSIIGAGSVVTKDTVPYELYMGNPAKIKVRV